MKFALVCVLIFIFSKVFSQLPACKDSFPTSLLPNNSFEQFSGCNLNNGGLFEGGLIDEAPGFGGVTVNNWHSAFGNTDQITYYNYNCRLHDSLSIFDSSIFCHSFLKVPMPLPDGPGFIKILVASNSSGQFEINSSKDYIATCLQQPLYAGQPYTFNFYFGFGKLNNSSCGEPLPFNSISPFGIAIYGRTDCPNYPIDNFSDTSGCLTHFSGWVILGRVVLSGRDEWVQGVMNFTPSTDIYSIAIGPDCTNYYNETHYNELNYFMDKFILAPTPDFAFKSITALSGNACTGNYVLQAPPNGRAYQWYKDGVVIPGATAQTHIVPDNVNAAGNYVANVSLPYNNCLNTLPFMVSFSNINKFSLGSDTTLCAPAAAMLDATYPSAQTYLWSNGSQEPAITVNTSGTYWAQLTDSSGCVKRDSVTVTVQGCDDCELFIPTAFTPNNDGLNDVFKAKPNCPNIGLQKYNMSIYNRWGQLVFKSSDINQGWNGLFNNQVLSGTYVYMINYSFKQSKPIEKKGTLVLLR